MVMEIRFHREVDNNPKSEDVGLIRLSVFVLGGGEYLRFSTTSLVRDFIDDESNECQGKEELNDFLWNTGINTSDIHYGMVKIIDYVRTCSAESEYSPGCFLEVRVELVPEDDSDDDDDENDDDAMIEEAVQESFDETSGTRSRPANKEVVKSLPRKIYNNNKKPKLDKKSSSEQCTICFGDFSNGGNIVTLPCGHDFDEDCVLQWFKTSHLCPLCRYQLPCEDQ